MTRRDTRRGAALLLALLVVILLEGLAALTLSAAFSRARLVSASRDAVEGTAVARHVLAEARVHGEAAVGALADADSVQLVMASPLPAWRAHVEVRRLGAWLRLQATATRAAADGRAAARQSATLLMRRIGADTLRVITP